MVSWNHKQQCPYTDEKIKDMKPIVKLLVFASTVIQITDNLFFGEK